MKFAVQSLHNALYITLTTIIKFSQAACVNLTDSGACLKPSLYSEEVDSMLIDGNFFYFVITAALIINA